MRSGIRKQRKATTVDWTDSDHQWMGMALDLARSGYSPPNPHVGCVIVKEGSVVGRGASEPAGGAHAEVVALREAGPLAAGSSVYVTLEPCNHHGRTGPCSVALAEAGVARVLVGAADPHLAASGGLRYLESRGVEVGAGLRAEEAEEVHRPFLTAVRRGRPYVWVKSAVTLDGKIAWPDGRSQWITGPEAREDGHRYRAQAGVVLVGRRTVEFDNPRLTARIEGVGRQPLRVVLDPSGRLTGAESVFSSESGDYLWLVGAGKAAREEQTELEDFDVLGVLECLWGRGETGVLVEGGAATVRRFFEAGCVDELVLYTAPKLFGDGLSWMGMGGPWLPDGIEAELVSTERLGRDLKTVYRLFS